MTISEISELSRCDENVQELRWCYGSDEMGTYLSSMHITSNILYIGPRKQIKPQPLPRADATSYTVTDTTRYLLLTYYSPVTCHSFVSSNSRNKDSVLGFLCLSFQTSISASQVRLVGFSTDAGGFFQHDPFQWDQSSVSTPAFWPPNAGIGRPLLISSTPDPGFELVPSSRPSTLDKTHFSCGNVHGTYQVVCVEAIVFGGPPQDEHLKILSARFSSRSGTSPEQDDKIACAAGTNMMRFTPEVVLSPSSTALRLASRFEVIDSEEKKFIVAWVSSQPSSYRDNHSKITNKWLKDQGGNEDWNGTFYAMAALDGLHINQTQQLRFHGLKQSYHVIS
ncbi:hypothetical protein V8F06_011791 [Rhypophila decipiens]